MTYTKPEVQGDGMANDEKILGVTAIRPVERKGLDKIKYLLYNKDTGEYLTRTPKSWALIFIFYVIYYSCLAGFWSLMMFIFFQTLSYDHPKWQGADGLIGTSPGLGLRPIQTDDLIDSSIIMFNQDSKEDGEHVAGWGGWADRSELFLKNFRNATGKSCTKDDPVTSTEACNFDVNSLGPCAKPGAGYDVGSPCIFLKLNRIFGLQNEYFDPAELPEDMPDDLKEHIQKAADPDQVWIDCKGEYPADVEALSDIKYFPETRGLPAKFFPYQKQENYQSPMVAVQFKNLPLGQLVHVECRAWAKNIGYSRRDKIGIGRLELLIFDNKLAGEREKALS